MATFTHKCPHCLTEHIALIVMAGWMLEDFIAALVFQCPKCRGPGAAIIETIDSRAAIYPRDWMSSSGDIAAYWGIKSGPWPAVPPPLIPDHLPEDVQRICLQAERNFPVAGNEEAAGTMYRKALDVGLKKIDPDAKGVLAARIKKLAADHKLTPAIAEWADHIRDLGNEAAHENEPPTREELAALRSFTEMVMRYLFTLPKMVELRKDPAAALLK